MKYRLLNYLACPYCKDKSFPLELVVIEVNRYDNRSLPHDLKTPLCDLYCAYANKYIKDIDTAKCDECIKYEVKTGVIYCSNCHRWYPVIDEIPRILPDNYRRKEEDIQFLKLHEGKLDENVRVYGKPYNLIENSEEKPLT
ncbi:MAG: Trm112 family protein [Ignisphaera sp.]|nr:Trm112 family protein [Ignisphaera sp.]MCX8168114.1 Trm112 family protein [Ignisphaera sp.]MDW8085451.1 Trm112 family protein [Ignisphaera sp.]